MGAEWVFDAGRGCLDLVNTMRDRHRGGRELLTEPAKLREWLTVAGLLTSRATVREQDLVSARELREAVDHLTRAVAQNHRPTPADVRLLNTVAAATPAPVPMLRIDASGRPRRESRRPADPVAAALSALAVDAIELATSEAVLRVCAAEDCGLRFVDSSPKRNRLWCSMARCGNRAKARAHYRRHSTPASGT